MLTNGIFGTVGLGVGVLFAILIFWSIVWKGMALWISAKENKKWWFVVLLFLNTAGILEIIYIFGFSGWGRSYFSKLKQKRSSTIEHEKKEEEKVEEKECDCTNCVGGECECDCHKPVKED